MMDRTKYIPSIVMLTAGFVVCIVTYISKYSLITALLTILCTMVVFFVLGLFIKLLINKFIVEPLQVQKEDVNENNTEKKESEDNTKEKENKANKETMSEQNSKDNN